MEQKDYKYLFDINSPADLRKLPREALPQVCAELRNYLIDTVTQTGGHFGAGLGVVELTVALHYVLNTPDDKLVFDVGHQAYPHKILTGRRDLMKTIRKKGGLSGFPNRKESEYDAFGTGHASTSISAALGIATARDINKDNYRVAAVIGDGSMTGGMAYEAMNNCGYQKRKVLIILNDNNFSIDKNISAISNYFTKVFSSNTAMTVRENLWNAMGKLASGDRLRKYASRLEDSLKAIVTPGVLFETLGFNYFGPINGNNIHKLVDMLGKIKDLNGPVFLHIMTEKGKGYLPAEKDKQKLHAIGMPQSISEKALPDMVDLKSFSSIFGEALTEICEQNDKVAAVTAAMADGTGLNILQKKYPEKVIDVGIAEGHAVTYAAGMATQDVIPVVAIYSTFLQRAYDSLIHDIALQDLHVVFALDRAGLVGEDGPTHHGTFDMAYLRSIPNMIVMAPRNGVQLRNMLYSAINEYCTGPSAIRFPRGKTHSVVSQGFKAIPLGKSELIIKGRDTVLIAVGSMVYTAKKAAKLLKDDDIELEVIDARFVKPLDKQMLDNVFARFGDVFTLEEGQAQGGFGSAVAEYAGEKKFKGNINILGLPDKFVEHGTQKELLADCGLDSASVAARIKNVVQIAIGHNTNG
ncbi:MAG: 1-deoxy-D-xylulose-5-phosphate synthase [bacterium]